MLFEAVLLWKTCGLLLLTLTSYSFAESITSSCADLKTRLHLHKTRILSATHISGPVNVSAAGVCQSEALVSTSICRVQFVTKTSPTSSVYAEAWLPVIWHGRFLVVGNGGLGGCVSYEELDYGSSYHFATVGTNNGHDGTNGSVFLNRPEVINDFAFRAIHVGTVIGKQIVEAYYGRPHHKSYYIGCSTGGRQGAQAALKFPEDFDGIIAGAPAIDWNHLLGWNGMLAHFIGAPDPQHSTSFIPASLWNVVAAEVLNQCDELDDVKDGIITEPDACDFRPEAIQCTPRVTKDCLSKAQVDALRQIYQPLFGLKGELLFPRYDPGTEADGNAMAVFNGSVVSYTRDWFRYVVLKDPSYNFSDFGRQHIYLAERINAGGISTFTGDFSAFEKRGGKFLTYHGRRDELIPSGSSKRLYNLISKTLHMPSLDSFYRLFLIPGMNHCYNGPGATAFGQGKFALPTTTANSSSHNILLAIVDWVESGVAPDIIVGTSESGEERVHCRYPQRSVWNGTAFVCHRNLAPFFDATTFTVNENVMKYF